MFGEALGVDGVEGAKNPARDVGMPRAWSCCHVVASKPRSINAVRSARSPWNSRVFTVPSGRPRRSAILRLRQVFFVHQSQYLAVRRAKRVHSLAHHHAFQNPVHIVGLRRLDVVHRDERARGWPSPRHPRRRCGRLRTSTRQRFPGQRRIAPRCATVGQNTPVPSPLQARRHPELVHQTGIAGRSNGCTAPQQAHRYPQWLSWRPVRLPRAHAGSQRGQSSTCQDPPIRACLTVFCRMAPTMLRLLR